MEEFHDLWFNSEGLETVTSSEQCSCEKSCSEFLMSLTCYSKDQIKDFKKKSLLNDEMDICLLRDAHTAFLSNGLFKLSSGFVSLDASRPWLCYWILHAMNLLGQEPFHLYPRVISTLQHMQDPNGGFCGGPGQLPHCAPTYAAVLALSTVGTTEAYESINRKGIYSFFMSMKDPSGGFRMHRDGEVDSRGTYTVVSIAKLLNILTPELTAGVAEYLISCQTYEGGFGGEPGNEAHGGYNFCSISALFILGQISRCNLSAQAYWLVSRQMKLEGGFQGRTNKLVDACYSFWQGGALAVVEMARSGGHYLSDLECIESLTKKQAEDMNRTEETSQELSVDDIDIHITKVETDSGSLLFNQKDLQKYILHCGQQLDGGGLRDKPGRHRDFYHSCYALSGLSVSQHSYLYRGVEFEAQKGEIHAQVYGDVRNLVNPTSAVFNIGLNKLRNVLTYFQQLPCDHKFLTSQ